MKYLGKITDPKDLINVEYADANYIEKLETMPSASDDLVNKIVQYVGTTTTTAPIYKNGYFYKCVNNSGTYTWQPQQVQDGGSITVTDENNAIHISTDVVSANGVDF